MMKKGSVKNGESIHANEQELKLRAEITALNDEIVNLRSQVFKLRDEIHTLRNSRVLGRIIKTRDFIGNPATLPKRTIYKTRRTVAKFVPDFIRLPLMRSLRSTRSRVESQVREYRGRVVKTITVQNTAWDHGLPLVSVVIPYYNRVDTIDDTLDSLKAQTFQNFETIIVDDSSNDPASIKRLETIRDARVIHHETNQGVATARNNGIREAKGKYIICLDSDDMLDQTFIEKATLTLESNPDIALVTTYQDMFGVIDELVEKHTYEPLRLIQDNMVITAAEFKREAWEVSGGYKPHIGYEDWEFWLTLSEHGFWGKLIPEALFRYRTSIQSRYVNDKDVHWNNLKKIRSLHPKYKSIVKALIAKRRSQKLIIDPRTALINMQNEKDFAKISNGKPNVLVTVPWLDFGGVSTLLYNFTREVKDQVNFHFVTGLHNKNEWEYKFKHVSPFIYHMPNMLSDDPELHLEFISNYIAMHEIDILHIVHNGFIYDMLPELKKRHPNLRVISTVFNDRVPYLQQSVSARHYIDAFTTDNQAVGNIYENHMPSAKDVIKVIPNGIDIDDEFNPKKFERDTIRKKLHLDEDELAVFFIGRLSEEKNPDVFLEVALHYVTTGNKKLKFFVIGDGNMKLEVMKTIYDNKSPQLNYLGYQSKVAEYLAAADVFVLPSSVEGFPLSILEAMAMGVCVIASDVGAVPDVIKNGKTGFVVEAGSEIAISEALDTLLKNPHQLADIKVKSRAEVIAKYSQHALREHYTKLYIGDEK